MWSYKGVKPLYLLFHLCIFVLFLLSIILQIPTFLLMVPANAGSRGTTTAIYLAPGEESVSNRPSSLTIENGQIAIVLASGEKVVVLSNDK